MERKGNRIGLNRRKQCQCGFGLIVSLQHLERMRPVVAREARNAPEHAERFDGARGFGFAHVQRFPAEALKNLARGAASAGGREIDFCRAAGPRLFLE